MDTGPASPDVGAGLRAAREAAGLSLTQMAVRTRYGRSYLGNVETGRRRATADVVLAYERALGEDVERRGVLSGLAASVVAPAAVGALIQRGFAAALGNGRVDDWLERVESYGRDYMTTGAAALQDRLAADLVVIQQRLDSPALWAAAARMLTVYGKTTPGAREASRWYRLATVAADRSRDKDTRVWVRGRSALALAYEGAGLQTATNLAEQALALSDDRPSLGALNARMALAHASAVRRDRATALEHLEDGRRLFDQAGSYEQVSDFAVPEWRMATFMSMLLSRLGHPKAVQAQDEADRTRPDTLPRFATHIELHRGLMMVRAGDVAGGVAYAQTALDRLPPERHSLSLRLMMAEIERDATPSQCP